LLGSNETDGNRGMTATTMNLTTDLKKTVIASLVAGFACLPFAGAQTAPAQTPPTTQQRVMQPTTVTAFGPTTGTREITFSGSGYNDRRFRSGAVAVNLSYGEYWNENLMWALRQGITFSDQRGGSSQINGSTRLAVDWHFNMDRMRPYVGASLGASYGEDIRNTFVTGFEGGLKYYVQSNTFMYGGVEYLWNWRRTRDLDDRVRDGSFIYTFGIGYNF
jgi:hypothetical protein